MNIDNALKLALEVHTGQRDKGGKPYILHPIRLAMRLRTDDEELMCIAILHDALEDSKLTVTTLSQLVFSPRVIEAVLALTHIEGESYEDYIKRVALNPDAKRVKIEDLRDNSDITRLKGLSKSDFDRMEKYHRAYIYLS